MTSYSLHQRVGQTVRTSTLVLLALIAVSCDLAINGQASNGQDSDGGDSNGRNSHTQDTGPSALGIAARQAEFQALFEDFDDYWFLERKTGTAARSKGGFLIPETCKETVTQAQKREQVLDNALILAVIDGNQREVYDLWGKKIDLLKDLDNDLKQGCQ